MDNFPCMECHKNINNAQAIFPLKTPHHNMTFKHMDSIKNCYLCHDKKDRDKLVLQDGTKIGFDKSYLQCASCHGEKIRDWKNGIHGKQIGSWNGKKYRSSCATCHDAHTPKFPQFVADPGPVHPNPKKHKGKGHE